MTGSITNTSCHRNSRRMTLRSLALPAPLLGLNSAGILLAFTVLLRWGHVLTTFRGYQWVGEKAGRTTHLRTPSALVVGQGLGTPHHEKKRNFATRPELGVVRMFLKDEGLPELQNPLGQPLAIGSRGASQHPRFRITGLPPLGFARGIGTRTSTGLRPLNRPKTRNLLSLEPCFSCLAWMCSLSTSLAETEKLWSQLPSMEHKGCVPMGKVDRNLATERVDNKTRSEEGE